MTDLLKKAYYLEWKWTLDDESTEPHQEDAAAAHFLEKFGYPAERIVEGKRPRQLFLGPVGGTDDGNDDGIQDDLRSSQ